ncbi:MAG: MptD family putative ECF transporter S component [Spirochaetia bacterium]|jgi:energy-coupling factor transport system substrate-specific component|nr:MptD family putative ECF transporter S component [Spirochaetia bacterium]
MSGKSYANQRGLTIKDLVTTGIFSALLWMAMFIASIPFGINPMTTFYMPIGSALLSGPIFLLLIAKVPKRGPITIAGILLGIIYFLLGMHWGMDLGYIICGIIADIIAGSKKYKSTRMNIVAYAILCLGGTGTYLVYFINPSSWATTMMEGGTTQSYIETMNAMASPIVLIIMFVGTIAIASLSGLVGKKLLKKQFKKAGITA